MTDYARIGRDPIGVILDLDASPEDVALAVAIMPWVEFREAHRRLLLVRGANQASIDQREQEIRELERRYPGIGDDA
jgi:hypothetical protein